MSLAKCLHSVAKSLHSLPKAGEKGIETWLGVVLETSKSTQSHTSSTMPLFLVFHHIVPLAGGHAFKCMCPQTSFSFNTSHPNTFFLKHRFFVSFGEVNYQFQIFRTGRIKQKPLFISLTAASHLSITCFKQQFWKPKYRHQTYSV